MLASIEPPLKNCVLVRGSTARRRSSATLHRSAALSSGFVSQASILQQSRNIRANLAFRRPFSGISIGVTRREISTFRKVPSVTPSSIQRSSSIMLSAAPSQDLTTVANGKACLRHARLLSSSSLCRESMDPAVTTVTSVVASSTAAGKVTTVTPIMEQRNGLVGLVMASVFGFLTTASLAYSWYDDGGDSLMTSGGPTTRREPKSLSFNRRSKTVSHASTTPPAVATINSKQTKSTKKPYDISVRAIRGGRFTMEDEYFVGNGGRFAAVFDGHGGSGVSAYLKNTLYETVNDFLQQKHWEVDEIRNDSNSNDSSSPVSGGAIDSKDVVKTIQDDKEYLLENAAMPSVASHVAALRAGFEKIERDVIEDDGLAYQGSTAVAIVLHESDDGSRTILSANVGDSRAILSRNGKAVDLTRDHKPNDEREKKRILDMGETIEWDAECMVHRVRNLSLARAIGDRYAKPAVSAEVEIKHFPVCEGDDEFVVLASDGLWDVMSSQDVVSFVHEYMDHEVSRMSKDNAENYKLVLRKNMAKLLAREAIRKGSTDNICVLMVWL